MRRCAPSAVLWLALNWVSWMVEQHWKAWGLGYRICKTYLDAATCSTEPLDLTVRLPLCSAGFGVCDLQKSFAALNVSWLWPGEAEAQFLLLTLSFSPFPFENRSYTEEEEPMEHACYSSVTLSTQKVKCWPNFIHSKCVRETYVVLSAANLSSPGD